VTFRAETVLIIPMEADFGAAVSLIAPNRGRPNVASTIDALVASQRIKTATTVTYAMDDGLHELRIIARALCFDGHVR
jgi:hypothetical protein